MLPVVTSIKVFSTDYVGSAATLQKMLVEKSNPKGTPQRANTTPRSPYYSGKGVAITYGNTLFRRHQHFINTLLSGDLKKKTHQPITRYI